MKDIETEINDFYSNILPYGSLDVKRAVEVAMEVNINGCELAEIIQQESEDLDTEIQKMDVVYTIYEHILQMARNKISEVAGFDFLNDSKVNGTDIYTYGNCMATSYDYSDEKKNELKNIINELDSEKKEELKDDKMTAWFLEQLDIKL